MYEIIFESKAEKELLELPKEILKKNPRVHGVKKLSGKVEGWRIRIGDYRILYQIDDDKKLVKVYRIKHRKEVYR